VASNVPAAVVIAVAAGEDGSGMLNLRGLVMQPRLLDHPRIGLERLRPAGKALFRIGIRQRRDNDDWLAIGPVVTEPPSRFPGNDAS
jgi:hypothetical protein